ncbi:MAG: hypothetical protein H8E44_42170 [Planctomycetes bacterium]|nr:hypothetical protein [Planctomycetota bacterium]MBL7043273.1 hypothetical protein [Pirellulaceae bacterium]
MEPQLQEYRQHLVLAEQKSQETYDKTVLSLSGGALGISFAFVDKFLTGQTVVLTGCLVSAWVCWGLSVAFALASHFCSQQALRHAIKQVDKGEIYIREPGGKFSIATNVCNVAGGVLFLVGLILMVFFVGANIGGIRNG